MAADVKSLIRTIPDWPNPPVRFRDVSSLLRDPVGFKAAMDILIERYRAVPFDVVAGLDARGFIPAGVLAYALGKPLVMVRKKGKLPGQTIFASYQLEYGPSVIEIQTDAAPPGSRVLLLDDLIATGGTLCAAVQLFHNIHCVVTDVGAIVNLPELNGSHRLERLGVRVFALCEFNETE
ncbi:MAG TPA: adenine phosphoribosyltransferase [Opitutaceae bacterium]|jgi:adenine phosphoribosyltransferase|nr:adenine phosphoribosyltransferase [Opitutaceae bacterium]